MLKELNDIKVPFRRYSKDVLIDTTPEGDVVLFNHNNISKCPIGVFTGIDFDLATGLTHRFFTVAGEEVPYVFWLRHLAGKIEDNFLYNEPILVVKFSHIRNMDLRFKGHLIELFK